MKKTISGLLLFLSFTFIITWSIDFALVIPMAHKYGYGKNVILSLIVSSTMFIPALSALITRFITKEGFAHSGLRPHFKGNLKHYFSAWFGMQILAIAGAVLYFLFFRENWDPDHTYILGQFDGTGSAMAPEAIMKTFFIQTAMALTIAPLVNFIPCFGEEWGWRGYMMPKLLKLMDFSPACIVGGIIWGIWHAPLIAVGHNYGLGYAGAPWTGIAMMSLFCVAAGTVFTYWCVKTGSCIPAIIGHGAINGFAAAPTFFIADNSRAILGPTMCGAVGMTAIIIVAAVILFKFKPEIKRAE